MKKLFLSEFSRVGFCSRPRLESHNPIRMDFLFQGIFVCRGQIEKANGDGSPRGKFGNCAGGPRRGGGSGHFGELRLLKKILWKKFSAVFLWSLFLYAAFSGCPAAAFSEILLLSPGEKTRMRLPPDKVARIGNKKILSLFSQGDRLIILGKQMGGTRLSLGSKSYRVFVLSPNQKRKVLLADRLLKNFWGLGWSLSGEGQLLITGTLNRLFDWARLAEAAKAHNISYEFRAQPGEGLRPAIREFFEGAFGGHPAPEIQWSRLPAALTPKGADIGFYAEKLKPFGLAPKEDESWFVRPPFIEIEIALVESGLSSSFSFGGAPVRASPEKGMPFSGLLGLLNFMKSEGKGKTIHHSSLFTQNGQEARVHSGGQIPFAKYHPETGHQTIQWKSYGLSLQITPLADKKGTIQLNISGEMSEPLSFLSASGPPPLKRQSLKTTLWVRDGGIVPLFRQRKKGEGDLSQGGAAPPLPFLKSLLHKRNRYAVSRFILIHPKILASSKKERGGRSK